MFQDDIDQGLIQRRYLLRNLTDSVHHAYIDGTWIQNRNRWVKLVDLYFGITLVSVIK